MATSRNYCIKLSLLILTSCSKYYGDCIYHLYEDGKPHCHYYRLK